MCKGMKDGVKNEVKDKGKIWSSDGVEFEYQKRKKGEISPLSLPPVG